MFQACFRVSRDDAQIMAKELLTPLYRQPPGWEFNIQDLQSLPSRLCFIKNKAEGGVVLIKTPEVLFPYELLVQAGGVEVDEETFKKKVDKAKIGAKYLRNRKTIEKQYQKRYKELTEVKEPESFREPKRK